MKQNSGFRDVPVPAALSPLSPQAQASQPSEQCDSGRGRFRNREALHAEIFYGKLLVSVAAVENAGIHHQIKSGSLVKQIAVIVFGNCPAIGFVADVSRRAGNRRPNLEKRIPLSSQTVPQTEILRLARPAGFEKAARIKGNPQRFISGYGVGGQFMKFDGCKSATCAAGGNQIGSAIRRHGGKRTGISILIAGLPSRIQGAKDGLHGVCGGPSIRNQSTSGGIINAGDGGLRHLQLRNDSVQGTPDFRSMC